MSNYIAIPDDTRSLHAIGAYITEFEARQNAFVDALVNRIGRVLVTSKMWNNPLAVFKQGYLELGETVEEIFANIADVESFDPEDAASTLFARKLPDVRAAFHTMNYQKHYDVTISQAQLRQAFLSWSGISDLVAKIVETLYTAMRYDEYCVMKYMVCRDILNGGLYVTDISTLNSEDNYKAFVVAARTAADNLTILSDSYNRAGVYNVTEHQNQYFIMTNATKAAIDVNVLAEAFNMDKAEFLGHIVGIDSFGTHDTARLAKIFKNDDSYSAFDSDEITLLNAVGGIQIAKDWFMVFDNLEQIKQVENGKGLYWNYFYHAWKTFSLSPFANAIVYYQGTSAITGVTVSPSTANVAQGTSASFAATVAGTGLIDKNVKWSLTGASKDATKIDPFSGVLYIASDEPKTADATETEEAVLALTVKATASDGTTYGTATVTVV